MNFDEWYNDFIIKFGVKTPNNESALCAWNACKQEVLKILNNNIRQKDLEEYNIDLSVIKEIEKL